jgi:arginase
MVTAADLLAAGREAAMTSWTLIGVPTSAGAHHAGQDLAPAALRKAGLVDRLVAAGVQVTDGGDLPGSVFAVDHESKLSRNLAAVTRVAGEVADAVADVVSAGDRPLVVGGDCTITIGVVAGIRRQYPQVGLVYVDGDSDLNASGEDRSGILDSQGIAHLLGQGAPELARMGGMPPLLEPGRLALVGCDPRESTAEQKQFLADARVSQSDNAELSADPEGAAARALAALAGNAAPLVVHFDVDVVDSGDLPLGNFPHYGSGVLLDQAVRAVGVLAADPACAALVLTEVNPTYDPDGSLIGRYIDGLVSALTPAASRGGA